MLIPQYTHISWSYRLRSLIVSELSLNRRQIVPILADPQCAGIVSLQEGDSALVGLVETAVPHVSENQGIYPRSVAQRIFAEKAQRGFVFSSRNIGRCHLNSTQKPNAGDDFADSVLYEHGVRYSSCHDVIVRCPSSAERRRRLSCG